MVGDPLGSFGGFGSLGSLGGHGSLGSLGSLVSLGSLGGVHGFEPCNDDCTGGSDRSGAGGFTVARGVWFDVPGHSVPDWFGFSTSTGLCVVVLFAAFVTCDSECRAFDTFDSCVGWSFAVSTCVGTRSRLGLVCLVGGLEGVLCGWWLESRDHSW